MSVRTEVLGQLMRVAQKLEATELYAAVKEDGEFNWSDPIHVRADRAPETQRQEARRRFEAIAKQSLPGGTSTLVEGAPKAKYCLTLPVWIDGMQAAIGCLIVNADSRLAYFMLQLALCMLDRPGDGRTGGG